MDPCELIERWPRARPLAALVSRGGGTLGRWSIFGVVDAPSDERAHPWRDVGGSLDDDAARLDELRSMIDAARSVGVDAMTAPAAPELPFRAGWIGFLGYELGACFEPSSIPRRRTLDGLPLAGGWLCRGALVHDADADAWWWTGDGAIPSDLCAAIERTRADAPSATIVDLRAERRPGEFARDVATVRELIRAGDLFQANVSQRWRARFRGCARTLAATAIRESGARYGAIVELPGGGAVISMSPELFLRVDAGGHVVTRPVKGTLRSERPAAGLAASEKDAAELAMIVDLMRNDLSRVCVPGSVHVETPRLIETHPTVHHGVAEVRGRLRACVDALELLRATFPPGSVTGAPKIRAMQVIDDLEPAPRGPYCGAIGFIEGDGALELNVAIRTITLAPRGAGIDRDAARTLTYSAGCGIVSDSDPLLEEAESVVKRRVLERTVEALERRAAESAPVVTPRGAAVAPSATGS